MEADSDLATRMCIVTRECLDEAVLLRFVRSPDGVAVPGRWRLLVYFGALGLAFTLFELSFYVVVCKCLLGHFAQNQF